MGHSSRPASGQGDNTVAADGSALAEKSPFVRVAFDLDRQKHVGLKIMAARSGKSVTDILRDLVERELLSKSSY